MTYFKNITKVNKQSYSYSTEHTTITADTTLDPNVSGVVRLDLIADTVITLAPVSDFDKKHLSFILVSGGFNANIVAQSPDTISGRSQIVLSTQNDTVDLYADNVNYYVKNGSTSGFVESDLMIWAEENGPLGVADEWSFGNGSEGITALTLMEDYDVIAMSFHAETAGTTVSEVELVTHNPTTSLSLSVTKPANQNSAFVEFPAPYTTVNKGDRLGFRTLAGGGAVDARVAVLLRKKNQFVVLSTEIPVIYQAKWYNTDVTTDFSVSTSTLYVDNLPIFGNEDVLLGNNAFTLVSSTEVTCNESGIYRLKLSIHTFSASARSNVLLRTKVNGTAINEVQNTGYIRATSGHNESSANLETIIQLNSGDTVQIGCRQEGAAGIVRFALLGSSSIHLEKIN